MKHLKNEKGEWVVRDDVQISFKVNGKVRKGGLRGRMKKLLKQ